MPPLRKKEAPAPRSGAESSRKVLGILLSFTPERPVASVETLAQEAGVPMSSAYRYVSLLREMGLLAERGSQFCLSARVANLARAARAAQMPIEEVARPILLRLRDETGETVLLMTRLGDNAVCLDRAESSDPIRLSFDVGSTFPLHRGAGPKALLAGLPPASRAAFLDRAAASDPALREGGRDALLKDLEAVHQRGYATSIAEITPQIWAAAAPVISEDGKQVRAVLSVAGPSFRITAEAQGRLTAATRAAAADLSIALGAPAEEAGAYPPVRAATETR
jgi:DNA-binding IclR family transcriptional regulator